MVRRAGARGHGVRYGRSVERWSCGVCSSPVRFDSSSCRHCGSLLGYVPDDLAVRSLTTTDDVAYHALGDERAWWRCLNAAYGCNWVLHADTGDVWCRSCRLTRGRPDDARTEAITAWASAEASKRRLVHQLDSLGLSVDPLSPTQSDGLVFDLVYLDSGGATTGYDAGVVTLDLAETDELHREHLRVQLGETFRTVIGHLRHETGHHYFHRLVSQSDDIAAFRALFGDETADYAAALSAHYAQPATWKPSCHVTSYATAHPLEDWAETFAHYLHICDAAESAAAHAMPKAIDRFDGDFTGFIVYWTQVIDGLSEIAEALGVADIYPFETSGAVVTKLAFVHTQVTKNPRRRNFYNSSV